MVRETDKYRDLKKIYETMNYLEKTTIRLIVFKIASEPFAAAELEKLTYGTGRDLAVSQIRAGLLQLRQREIILTFKKTCGSFIYLLPLAMLPVWQEILLEPLEGISPTQQLVASHPYRRGILQDIFRLLAYIFKNELVLTAAGTIHKRHISKITEQLALSDLDLEHLAVYLNPSSCPVNFKMVYELAVRMKLVEINPEGKLSINHARVNSFFGQNEVTANQILYRVWRGLHLPSAAWIQHVAVKLQELSSSTEWLSLRDIGNWLAAQCLTNQEWDIASDHKKQLLNQWLAPLAALGWIELSFLGQENLWVRWLTPVGTSQTVQSGGERQANLFLIQANFEIMAPPTLTLSTRWELECISEHLQTEHISRFVITKQQIYNACKNYRTINEILLFLKNNSKYPMPVNVEKAIIGWGERAALEGKSHFPEMDMSEKKHDDSWEADISLLDNTHPRFSKHAYAEVRSKPAIGNLYSGLSDIPPIWLKEYREYHVSVRKELITKAIEWNTFVRFRNQGVPHLFIPQQIVRGAEFSFVTGLLDSEKASLRFDYLTEIQLILPGIND